ncbi:MAG: PQQ-dependent sugar dehydrogenase [Myxococcota bacterium]
MRRPACVALLVLAACGDSRPAEIPPAVLQVEFEEVPFETSIEYVTDMAFVPDGSGEFVAIGLSGEFEVARMSADPEEGAAPLLSGRFTDVFTEFDAGMLGLALHPDFVDNDLFYIATNIARDHVQVRRYTLDRGSFERTRNSEVIIIDLPTPGSPRWHNISSLGFDDDGVMWLLVGDRGLFDPAQDPTGILGSLIRIVPSTEEGVGGFTTPADAPLYAPGADPSVHSIGVRSPWKGRYHEGRWYYGDVGLDTFEEINVIGAPGTNLGWPVVEGLCADDVFDSNPDCELYTDPEIAYGRSTSEPFVRDDFDANPTNLRSVYVGWIYQPVADDPYAGLWNDVMVFGDAFLGFIRAASLDDLGASWHLGHLDLPTAWGQGPDGFVYVTSYMQAPPDPLEPKGAEAQGESALYRVVLDTDRDDSE